jgi:hypothetical protein
MTRGYQYCRVCNGRATQLHHIFPAANRKHSDKYNLVVWLCLDCHQRMHKDKKLRERFQLLAKEKFKRENPDLNFRSIFGKEYV